MSTLVWSEELAVRHPEMDATHQEFIVHLQQVDACLAAVKAAPSTEEPDPAALAALIERFDAMIDHTQAHFEQEDRWMLDTGFGADNCHSLQHKQVLELVREVRRRLVEQGEIEWMERLMPELVQWFFQHAQAADAGLAYHLGQVGYDTETRRMRETPADSRAEPAPAMTGCASAACAG